MWPFILKNVEPPKNMKLVEKAAAQPRLDDGSGRFVAASGAAPARLDKQIESEKSSISGVLGILKELKEAGLIGGTEEDEYTPGALDSLEGWAPVVQAAMPFLGPCIPGIAKKLGIDVMTSEQINTVISPTSSPEAAPAASVPGYTPLELFKMAAETSPALMKAALPLKIYPELAKQGISMELFKKAVHNLSKAV